MKKEIESLIHEYSKVREKKLGIADMSFFKRIYYSLFGEGIISDKVDDYAKKIPDDINQMIKGVATGAEVPLQTLYEINLFVDLNSKGIDCSAALIKKENRIIHAWNHDVSAGLNDLVGKHIAITNYKIDGKNRYTQVGMIAMMFTVCGINEKGLSLSINTISQLKNYKKENCNVHAYLNKIMTDCNNLAEVDAFLNTINLNVGYIVSIGSHQENKAAMFDVFGEVNVRTDIEEVLYASNHIVSPNLTKKNEFKQALDFSRSARDSKFYELYNQKNNNDLINKTADILACTDFFHYSSGLHDMATINNYYTVQSVIFDPTNQTIYVASNPVFAGWSKRIHYNTSSEKISLYREEDKRLKDQKTIDFINYSKNEKNFDEVDEVKLFSKKLKSEGLQNYSSLINLYNEYYKLEEFELARQEGLKLVEQYPDIVTGYYYIGLTFEQEKNFKEAISWYLKSQNATITNEYRQLLVKMHLAFAYQGFGDLPPAKIYANLALQIYKQYYIPENSTDFIKLEEICGKVK